MGLYRAPRDNNPRPISVKLSHLFIYVLDGVNNRLSVYWRSNWVRVYTAPSNLYGIPVINQGASLYIANYYGLIADAGANSIHIISSFVPGWTQRIGAGGNLNIPLASPEGVAISGNKFIIADTGNHRILRVYPGADLELESTFGSYGSGPNNFNIPKGLCCDEQFYYT